VSEPVPPKSVERLFPFVLKSRNLLVGRDTLRRSKGKLHFILITEDVSENSRTEVLADFRHYPVVQCFVSADLEKHFGVRGAKVVGFAKSGLAQSIYAELKPHRINQPVTKSNPPDPAQGPAAGRKAAAKPPAQQKSRP
jgi:ribosomal protein L7Ae-like RNA K-turn-binding protein